MDLSKYTLDNYMRIVTYKTAYYSFYLPVACGMLLAGITEPAAYKTAEKILVEMGQYFQVRCPSASLVNGELAIRLDTVPAGCGCCILDGVLFLLHVCGGRSRRGEDRGHRRPSLCDVAVGP